ncbi:MAG: hypothetical protein ACLGP3_07155 [Acidobacteriota bacterium]
MKAIESLLSGFIDYAGLYPPAALDMHTAVRNYLESSRGPYRRALGRFVIDLERFPYLWDAAGEYVRGMRLTVVAQPDADWDEQCRELSRLLGKGYAVEAVEIKAGPSAERAPAEIERIAGRIPAGVTAYFEVPVSPAPPAALLDAVAAAGARIKIRMGGMAVEAFPTPQAAAQLLAELAGRRMLFKATAGLHHPVRGRYALSSAPQNSTAVMHGFMNLACAAALLHFGGEAAEAQHMLEEEWPGAWQVRPDAILWGENGWNADELQEVRQHFLIGVGSCSFAEPIEELEALGWY